jgi:small glutamine-rich tetratricopeptide repeat-containing protein alpha
VKFFWSLFEKKTPCVQKNTIKIPKPIKMSISEQDKKIASSICSFLELSLARLPADSHEGLQVAMQCISGNLLPTNQTEAFNLEDSATAGPSLSTLFENLSVEEEDADARSADELKSAGNKQMAEKDYTGAIALYSKAIQKDSSNAVFYANRAAAYSQNSQHQLAINGTLLSYC